LHFFGVLRKNDGVGRLICGGIAVLLARPATSPPDFNRRQRDHHFLDCAGITLASDLSLTIELSSARQLDVNRRQRVKRDRQRGCGNLRLKECAAARGGTTVR
jgi:hypothetical protein